MLASVGLYGVVAHGVAERRREFGIRAALGASRRDVWRLVLRQSATIIGAGVAIGLVGAYAFAQVLASRLVGVSPLDPALWALDSPRASALGLVARRRRSSRVQCESLGRFSRRESEESKVEGSRTTLSPGSSFDRLRTFESE